MGYTLRFDSSHARQGLVSLIGKPHLCLIRKRIVILRSAGGMVTAVNELRNNNTIAHPNGYLIQKREAQLVIRLVNAIIDYIKDIEDSIG